MLTAKVVHLDTCLVLNCSYSETVELVAVPGISNTAHNLEAPHTTLRLQLSSSSDLSEMDIQRQEKIPSLLKGFEHFTQAGERQHRKSVSRDYEQQCKTYLDNYCRSTIGIENQCNGIFAANPSSNLFLQRNLVVIHLSSGLIGSINPHTHISERTAMNTTGMQWDVYSRIIKIQTEHNET